MSKTQETVDMVANYVNNVEFDGKEFAQAMSQKHRTLQENFTLLCYEWLKLLSKTENYDERNEMSVMFAKRVMKKEM